MKLSYVKNVTCSIKGLEGLIGKAVYNAVHLHFLLHEIAEKKVF